MICSRCGTEKIENANYCIKCGFKFANESLEEVKDTYLVNYSLSAIIGICSGIITGIFSAALSESIHLEWWGWIIVLCLSAIGIGFFLFSCFKTLKNALIRQLRRKYN